MNSPSLLRYRACKSEVTMAPGSLSGLKPFWSLKHAQKAVGGNCFRTRMLWSMPGGHPAIAWAT
eukprot:6085932-Amphidinium_carterae.1